MRSDIRKYWRDPRFWRWWWGERVSGDMKAFVAVIGALACGIAGLLGGAALAATDEAATSTTQRVVTVARKTGPFPPPKVVTKSQTVTQPRETDVVTVQRHGGTVVRRASGETVTVRGPVEQRVVTNARTNTVVRTETADRVRNVTSPPTTETLSGRTETVTRDVTQPARTVTETKTEEVTVAEAVTVTVTVVTVAVTTVTVPVPPGFP
jgi:hypothetical protein